MIFYVHIPSQYSKVGRYVHKKLQNKAWKCTTEPHTFQKIFSLKGGHPLWTPPLMTYGQWLLAYSPFDVVLTVDVVSGKVGSRRLFNFLHLCDQRSNHHLGRPSTPAPARSNALANTPTTILGDPARPHRPGQMYWPAPQPNISDNDFIIDLLIFRHSSVRPSVRPSVCPSVRPSKMMVQERGSIYPNLLILSLMLFYSLGVSAGEPPLHQTSVSLTELSLRMPCHILFGLSKIHNWLYTNGQCFLGYLGTLKNGAPDLIFFWELLGSLRVPKKVLSKI